MTIACRGFLSKRRRERSFSNNGNFTCTNIYIRRTDAFYCYHCQHCQHGVGLLDEPATNYVTRERVFIPFSEYSSQLVVPPFFANKRVQEGVDENSG